VQVHPDKFAGPLYTIPGQKTGLAEPEIEKELEITDKDVATLMEALAIPRGEAISLLKAYDGSMENIFAGWMA